MSLCVDEFDARIADIKDAIAVQKRRVASLDPLERAGARKHVVILRNILVIERKQRRLLLHSHNEDGSHAPIFRTPGYPARASCLPLEDVALP